MKLINFSTNIPEENIAFDEFMLEKAERGVVPETLRFWESEEYFVVLGRAGKVSEECDTEICEKDSVKIIRRSSGGGTVLQGPGCLNYSLILEYPSGEGKTDIRLSYSRVLNGIAEAFAAEGISVKVLPMSDLAADGKKISGNAQARKRRYFLHHGTLLLNFDLSRISTYLKHPPCEPEYRKGRLHEEFVANLSLGREEVEGIIKKAFCCDGEWSPGESDIAEIKRLGNEKYSNKEWNWCF